MSKYQPGSSFSLEMNQGIKSDTEPEILDDRTARVGESRLRITPQGQPMVDELVFVGDIIETDYGTGGRVIHLAKYKTYGLPVFTVVYVDVDTKPNKNGSYRQSDHRWINELVAQDSRVLKLFETNDDEVILTGKTEGQSSLKSFFRST